jgi:hypothetical protein
MNFSKRFLLMIFAVAAGTILSAAQVHAAPITFTSRAAWITAIGGSPSFNVDFSAFTVDTEFRTQTVDAGPFSLRQVGSDPAGPFRNMIDAPPFQFSDNNGTTHASMFTNFGFVTVDLTFDTSVSAWGADLFGAGGGTGEGVDIDVLLDGGGVLTFEIPPTPSAGFFGFILDPGQTATKITFKSHTNLPTTGLGEGFGMDNVAGLLHGAEPIPEPATLVLLGTGLAGVGASLRRRKSNR